MNRMQSAPATPHVVAPVLMALAALLATACLPSPPKTPVQQPVTKHLWLDQGWDQHERQWFHHADQGTATFIIPYDWLLHLERPRLRLFGDPGLMVDPAYIQGFGFIPSPRDDQFNPDGLPVGFVKAVDQFDPATGKRVDEVGLTCAACHTGQLSYRGTVVYVDGGPAVANVTDFTIAVGMAVGLLDAVPGRLGRFAERLYGPQVTAAQKAELRADVKKYLAVFKHIAGLTQSVAKDSVTEGYGRLDALDRIGNQVFAIDAGKPDNFVATAAPVNYPHIWTSPWFRWVQYDASIMQPMVRNAGEALGVAAPINLMHPGPDQYRSGVPMQELYRLEESLAGTDPLKARAFNGLRAPRWPEEVLGPIDRDLAQRGHGLYERYCQGCHLAPVDSDAFWSDSHWQRIRYDRRNPHAPVTPQTPAEAIGETDLAYLNLIVIGSTEIGTDPAQWQSLNHRSVDVRGLDLDAGIAAFPGVSVQDGEAPFGFALAALVERAIDDWAARHDPPLTAEQRWTLEGSRPNQIQAPEGYKARPLNGVWATAPFLHNGSVPTVYDLLSPVAERPQVFWLGNRTYDPVHLGYESGELQNATRVDTRLAGNHNTGHEFNRGFDPARAGKPQGGLIGPYLTPEERLALIEFLKTQ